MPWYRIEYDQVTSIYIVTGSSPLTAPELALALEGTGYLHLTDLVYQDGKNRFKSWRTWDAHTKPEVWLNPRRVISFQELVRAPEVE